MKRNVVVAFAVLAASLFIFSGGQAWAQDAGSDAGDADGGGHVHDAHDHADVGGGDAHDDAELRAEMVVSGLQFPVSLAVLPEDRVLVTEKAGSIRLIDDGELVGEPVARLEPRVEGEAGLLGIAPMPDFEDSGEFLVTYTPSAEPSQIYLSRLRLNGTSAEILEDPWLTFPSRPEAAIHFGGNVHFGPDDHLFVALGELDEPERAQNEGVLSGSLLRYNSDGSIPDDNPFNAEEEPSPVYAIGMRNPFDFDVTDDGRVWAVDNGHHLHDEINLVEAGGNYGWPLAMGFCDHYPLAEICHGEGFTEPRYEYKDAAGPSAIVSYDGSMMAGMQGDLLMAGWHTGRVDRFEVPEDGGRLQMQSPAFVLPSGTHEHQHLEESEMSLEGIQGVTDVAVAGDGAVYVLLSGSGGGGLARVAPGDEIEDSANVIEQGTYHPDHEHGSGTEEGCAMADPAAPTEGVPLWIGLLVLGWIGVRSRDEKRRSWRPLLAGAVAGGTLLFGSLSVNAQEIDVGGKIGATVSMVSGDNSVNTQFGPGLAVGPAMRVWAFDNLWFGAELFYAQKGTGAKLTDQRVRFDYLTLPVRVGGTFQIGPVRPHVFGGASVNYLMHATSGGDAFTGNLERFELGLLGGVGVDVELPTGALTIDGRYERGMTNLADEEATPAYLQTPSNENNVIYIMVGYLY